jgi:mannose-6-phosphate isomerase
MVAQMITETVDESKPYAELWMGTHPNGPSQVTLENGSQAPLADLTGGSLAYLFKILSVNTALSIQAHPDRKLAQQLHADRPHIYKDPNHKPEIAIALTDFEAMCQFRPIQQIKDYLQSVPELVEVVSQSAANAFIAAAADDKQALRTLFTTYINADMKIVVDAGNRLVQRFSSGAQQRGSTRDLDVPSLVVRLSQQYPGDVGIFAPFFLNCVRISPGEAMFLAANEPHAYLSGDILEAMACSDNVVRAGLTPKLIDKETLCSMLTYNTGAPDILTGDSSDNITCSFTPPIPDFAVSRTELKADAVYDLSGVRGCSILIVLEGGGSATSGQTTVQLQRGNVLAHQGSTDVHLVAGSAGLLVARCYEPGQASQL